LSRIGPFALTDRHERRELRELRILALDELRIRASARRRGVALSGTRLLTDWAFDAFGLRRIELDIDDANEPSLRLAQQLGAVREPGRSVLER